MAVGGILGGAMAGAGIQIVIKAVDQYSSEFKKLDRSIQTQKTGFQKLGMFLKSTGIGYAALAGAAVGFATKAIKSALDTERAMQSFKIVVGETAGVLLRDLREASKGMVSDFELMASANRALMLGIDKNKLPELMEIAAARGKVMGRTVTEAFNDITIGIGRQSKLILDNLGIIVNAEDAYKRYASQLGKTSDQLTEVEKKQAFVNEVISQSTGLTEAMRYATETHTEKLQRLSAGFKNITSTLGITLLEIYDWTENLVKASIAYDLWGKDIKSPEIFAQLNKIGDEINRISKETQSLSQQNEAYIKDLEGLVKTTFPEEIELKKERLSLEKQLAEGYNKTREAISKIEDELSSSRNTAESLLSSLTSIQITLAGESEKNIAIAEKEAKINKSKLKLALGAGEEEQQNLERLQSELDTLRLQRQVEFTDIKNIEQAKNEMYIAEQQGIIQTVAEFMKSNKEKKKAYAEEMKNVGMLEDKIESLRKKSSYMSDEEIDRIEERISKIDEELEKYGQWREEQSLIVEGWKMMKDSSGTTMESINQDIRNAIDGYEKNKKAIDDNAQATNDLTKASQELSNQTTTFMEKLEVWMMRLQTVSKGVGSGLDDIVKTVVKNQKKVDKAIESTGTTTKTITAETIALTTTTKKPSTLTNLFKSLGLFGFQKGGYVPETGPALLHKGEYVVPANQVERSMGITIYINNLNGFNARDIAEKLQDELGAKIRI